MTVMNPSKSYGLSTSGAAIVAVLLTCDHPGKMSFLTKALRFWYIPRWVLPPHSSFRLEDCVSVSDLALKERKGELS